MMAQVAQQSKARHKHARTQRSTIECQQALQFPYDTQLQHINSHAKKNTKDFPYIVIRVHFIVKYNYPNTHTISDSQIASYSSTRNLHKNQQNRMQMQSPQSTATISKKDCLVDAIWNIPQILALVLKNLVHYSQSSMRARIFIDKIRILAIRK